jgi:hypothetical protein
MARTSNMVWSTASRSPSMLSATACASAAFSASAAAAVWRYSPARLKYRPPQMIAVARTANRAMLRSGFRTARSSDAADGDSRNDDCRNSAVSPWSHLLRHPCRSYNDIGSLDAQPQPL